MFDLVQEKKRWVQIILLLIIIPFALWGIDSYRKISGGADVLATVDGEKVTRQEFDNGMRQQQERLREMMRGAVDPALLDRPEIKHAVLDELVNQKLMLSSAKSLGLWVSDSQLAQVITSYGAFQKDGRFDRKQYETALRTQNMTPQMFESLVRQDMIMRQMVDGYMQGGYSSQAVAETLVRLNEQQRQVSVAQISLDPFLKQVKIDDAAVKDFYEKNIQAFRMPERARVEYVTYSADTLQQQVQVSAEEIKAYYDEHQKEYGSEEQRRASHILIAPKGKSDADKEAARVKAEQLLQQLKQSPAKFAELAKQNSADPISAARGGDLDFFGRGMMVKPFEDAVFSLKPGELSSVVQSDFGFHIIKLTAIKPAHVLALAEVKGSVEQIIRKQKAADKFAEMAEKFSNTVYEQSDSLKPAAELVKAQLRQSDWLVRGQAGAAPWTDKAMQAVFSDDVIKNKRNSSAVEIGQNMLLAVRLVEYQPAAPRPLAEVSDAIRKQLQLKQAADLAMKQGEATLAQLQQGEKVQLAWKSSKPVSRVQRGELEPQLGQRVMQADASKLPAYVGVQSSQGGYLIARVEGIKEVASVEDAKRDGYLRQMQQITGEELFGAFMADARKHASIKIKEFKPEEK